MLVEHHDIQGVASSAVFHQPVTGIFAIGWLQTRCQGEEKQEALLVEVVQAVQKEIKPLMAWNTAGSWDRQLQLVTCGDLVLEIMLFWHLVFSNGPEKFVNLGLAF